jgi:glyoxylase-like metal-dependent hydrolase (beta-lactamase superfamily II)
MKINNSITPKEVKSKLCNADNGFLLVDIRDEPEYNDWHINGSFNVPVNTYVATGEYELIKKAFIALPKDKQLITVCARGINSQLAASILKDLDYNAIYMKDGMKGWNGNFDIYEIPLKSKDTSLDVNITQFVRVGKGCLSYIVSNNSTKEAAVIDPSIFTEEYLQYVEDKNLIVKYVIDTHSHADHFSGAMQLAKDLKSDYYINKMDFNDGFEYKSLVGSEKLYIGKSEIEIFSTPGHTDGSLSFLVNKQALICGDLLLLESVGRPDLARNIDETIAGSGKLYNTLHNFLFKLGGKVKIFPAHFTTTSLRPVVLSLYELKQNNPALTIDDKNEFIKFITGNIPLTPPNYHAIKKYNKSGVIIPRDYAEDLEIGPNRCAAR